MRGIWKPRYVPFIFILGLLILVSGAPYALAAPTEKNVLILHQFAVDYPAHQRFNEGLSKEFEEEGRYKFNYCYEYLNMDKFPDNEAYLAATAEYLELKQKYSNWRPDVIVASDGVASFLSNYGNEIFADVPIISVWSGEGKIPPNLPELSSKNAVLSVFANFDKNIRLILDTQKDLKKVYIVSGDSDGEKDTLDQIKKAAEPYNEEVEFVYLHKLSYREMLDTLRQASDDSAILFVRWVTDAEGNSFVPVRVLDTIIKEVRVPVFGTQGQYLGTGIMGGYLYDLGLIGQRAAQMAVQMIDGEKPEDLRMTDDQAHEYAFDWRALERWDIDPNKLPDKSRFEYREDDLWSLYGKYFIIGGIVIFLETVLIAGLITNRRKRRKAENELLSLNNSLEKLVDERTLELQTAKARLEVLNRQLDFSARIDALTGLYNRRHMEERLNEEYQVFIRAGQVFSVMMTDIDDFKKINDQYGHDAGDAVLKTLSNTLRAMVRDYDVVARWGGEEFLLLFPRLTMADTAGRAEAIRKAVAEDTHWYNGKALAITVTIGAATISKNETIEEVIKRADNALYQGKSTGKNKVIIAL